MPYVRLLEQIIFILFQLRGVIIIANVGLGEGQKKHFLVLRVF